MAKPKLTKKQAQFCKEYMIDLNATQAAIRSGYSEKTGKTIGGQNLSKLIIQQEIERLMAGRSEKVEYTAKNVLDRLIEIDSLDIIDILNETLTDFKGLSQWPKSWRTSISGIDLAVIASRDKESPIDTVIKKIKWPDKVKNLEMLGRHVEVKAWDKEAVEEQAGEPVNVTFNVSEAVSEISVTNAKP